MLGEIPGTSGLPQAVRIALNGLTSTLNGLLLERGRDLEQSLGVTIHYLDIAGHFREIIADPSAFGMTNVTDPMLGSGQTEGHLFWDDHHPTTATHQLIAAAAYAAVVPEPSSIALLGVAGAALAAGAGLRRRSAKRAA